MMRRFISAWIAACITFFPFSADAVLKGVAAAPGLQNAASVAITGGTITGTNVPYVWAHYDIPIGIAPTTTYNNNGAAVLGTAMNATYANIYLAVPASSIAAGVPASTDIYYGQMSSTTAITFFNNRLADNLDANGGPTIPASPTAFVTTGAGSVAGVTGAVALLTLTLPASTLSATGTLFHDELYAFNTSTNSKTITSSFGGTNVINAGVGAASIAAAKVSGEIHNRNSASAQYATTVGTLLTTGLLFGTNNSVYLAINTGSSVAIVFNLTHATATDCAVLEAVRVSILK